MQFWAFIEEHFSFKNIFHYLLYTWKCFCKEYFYSSKKQRILIRAWKKSYKKVAESASNSSKTLGVLHRPVFGHSSQVCLSSDLPGQGWMLQDAWSASNPLDDRSVCDPGQGVPPCCGGVQRRVLVWVPPPQDTEHLLHSFHCDKRPSTTMFSCRQIYLWCTGT